MVNEELLQQRLNAFKPEPLINIEDIKDDIFEIPTVENGIDLAKANYLDVLNNKEIMKASEDIIREYGVGTCGPRAFYGTTDVHLEVEERLADFLHLEECIVYSYGFVAISSSIAAYCKRSDLVFIAEDANIATEQGLQAAKSQVVRFANPQDLRSKISNSSSGGKPKRKFLILEGISWATGKLCPLGEFLQIAEEFKMRVFLDETYSLGVYGENGRGLTEHFRIDPNRVDMIFGTLEGAIGSIGGFCAGSKLTIEHQRLSGSGYIFSASLPTYLAKVVVKSLDLLGEKPRKIRALAKQFQEFLEDSNFEVLSHCEAPFKTIALNGEDSNKIHEYCKENGVHFIRNDKGLMINLNVKLLEDEESLKHIYETIKEASTLIN